ncbi:cbb3-type cytochrome c oxidase subunit I [Leptolyngbya sp. 15MV]|nr:cbb3-type cytochrome c oxidase subunit I [Leptolyngbya sp. 15MV]
MIIRTRRTINLASMAAPLALLAPVAVTAQDASSTQAVQSGQGVGEIVVTAQRREESLQDTPISIVALTAEDLEAKRIDGLIDLRANVPNLQLTPFPNNAATTQIFLRGVGLSDDQITQDGGVAVYQDGVYVARSQGQAIEVADLERVEVLRGPQGTLYGRNATGGAINFITRKPELGRFGFKGQASVHIGAGGHTGGYGDHAGHHEESYLASRGSFWENVKSWATTIDHKKIGVMYLFTILFMFFLGGVAALALRSELFYPVRTMQTAAGETVVTGQLFRGSDGGVNSGNDIYNRLFTLHGAIMVFMFIIPSIPAALGNFLLPLMLGAKDVAFPRLNLLSWYIYVFGSIFAIGAILMGGVDTGWTFYTPYSTMTDADHWRVVWMVLGVFILGFSSILTGLNFVVTVHKLRAPGMGWFDMPLFVWSIYATALIQILATPVLAITLLLLIFERIYHVGIFDPRMGGDPVLFQHFFWFYSHPAVYIMILPGFAIINETIAVHARKRIFGYRAVAFSSLSIAAISFLVWGHHMFTSQGEIASAIFSALTFLVAIPTAVKMFNWTATLYKGNISCTLTRDRVKVRRQSGPERLHLAPRSLGRCRRRGGVRMKRILRDARVADRRHRGALPAAPASCPRVRSCSSNSEASLGSASTNSSTTRVRVRSDIAFRYSTTCAR